MKWLIRIVGGLLTILALVVAGLVGWLYVTDLARYQSDIEALITRVTGRDVTIGGDFEFTLLPVPRLVAEQVSLANASWGTEPMMAEIGHLTLELDLASLIRQPVIVREFRLHDANLLLESNAAGEQNTQMGDPKEPKPEPEPKPAEIDDAAGGLPLMVDMAEIKALTITRRAPGVPDEVNRIDQLSIEANEQNQLALQIAANVQQHPLALAGTLAPIDQVQALGTVHLDLHGSWGKMVDLTINGEVADLQKLAGAQVEAKLQSGDASALQRALKLPLKLSGPLDATLNYDNLTRAPRVKLAATAGAIDAKLQATLKRKQLSATAELNNLAALGPSLDIANLPSLPLTLEGTLSGNSQRLQIETLAASLGDTHATVQGVVQPQRRSADTKLSIKGDNLQQLKQSLPALPFSATTHAQIEPGYLKLEDIDITLDDSDVKGLLRYDSRERRRLTVKLKSQFFDMSPFLKQPDDDKPKPEPKPEAESPASTTPEAGRYVFSDKPIPFDKIKDIDAVFNLQVKKWANQERELSDIEIKGQLRRSDLLMRAALTGTRGGRAAAQIALNAAIDQPTLAVRAGAEELKLRDDTDKEGNKRIVPATSITVKLDTAGRSPRELAAASNGRILLTQGSGQVENAMLNSLSGDILAQLFSALNPLAKEEKYTRWDCTVISMDIEDGLSIIDGLLLQGEKIMVVGGGEIDLNDEDLKIEFNTKPRKGVGLSADMFVTPFVQLGGTLAEPGIELNTKGAILTTGAAVATLGMSVLITGVAERASAEGDKCEKTLEALPPHAPLP